MRPRATKLALALALAGALGGCQDADVGQRCPFTWGTDPASPPPRPETAAGDYFETGNTACDDLVCIVSPVSSGSRYDTCEGDSCGYCSKPCVSDQDCFEGDTGLVCRQLVLDPAFLATLDEATLERYLSDVRYTSYCVVPR